MRIIDLLNKIANGEIDKEKVYIIFKNCPNNVFGYDKEKGTFVYLYKSKNKNEKALITLENLNDEVEIIEEPKKIEKLDIGRTPVCSTKEQITQNKIDVIWKKMNEIIDKLNEIGE